MLKYVAALSQLNDASSNIGFQRARLTLNDKVTNLPCHQSKAHWFYFSVVLDCLVVSGHNNSN